MNYATVLVHLDDSPHSDARADFALDFALRHNAHLIGLYLVRDGVPGAPGVRQGGTNPGALEARRAECRSRAQAYFEAAAHRAGRPFEWQAPEGFASGAATLYTRHADLAIVGEAGRDDPAASVAPHFVEDLVMTGGRPVIVLPHAGPVKAFGENVVLAWDGSREAARATADALPILKRARFVTVATVERHADRDKPAGFDVSGYLERHRVRAGFVSLPRIAGLSTGVTLLNQLSDTHADLLVMGAYAHTRAREWVLGGVTRTLLDTLTVPVLMSH